MPQLLLELLSEEIPARMQARAANDLQRLVCSGLQQSRLAFGAAQSYATPRRLTLVIDDVAAASETLMEERKGPRVSAPQKAIDGFLRGAGLASVDQATVVSDAKKGDYYVARTQKPGQPAEAIIAAVVPDVVKAFPWPKSMRWGSGDLTWVRPLQSILALLGGAVIDLEVAGIKSCDRTVGHRMHGGEITVRSFEDYGTQLREAKVLLPGSERAAMIKEQAEALAQDAGLELVEDEALLLENAGLTEWPTAMIGTFDPAFLEVPEACLITSMKMHQKCFSLRDPKTGRLANCFILVANLVAADGGKSIVSGNERVIAARLSDAQFFWQQDLQRPLDEMAAELDQITFHQKLGTQKDRVERISHLAHEIAGAVDADADDARRAAQLCKADLVSGMVGEFPELQGLMGRHYAQAGGIKDATARAIELHYKPRGPSDAVPLEDDGDSVAIAVALADKLDMLAGFWAIDEKPTGSGDPYQLRRAALGVMRICIENDLRLSLRCKISIALTSLGELLPDVAARSDVLCTDLILFFSDRLKVYLRDKGYRHDLIDAVLALGQNDDIALIVRRVEALTAFLDRAEGADLSAGLKRANNILTIEEKKIGQRIESDADGALLKEPAERELAAVIAKVKFDTQAAINVENFEGAMNALSELRGPVDQFFDAVTVNDADDSLRLNRLKLLSQIRDATVDIADFSLIAGNAS